MALVLIAEDNSDHQRFMAGMIRRLGHDVTVADDGWAALVAATHNRPDLVIADVDMPEMDGLQLCRALHEDAALAAVPVILVTALLLADDRRLAVGNVVAVVRKPFGIPELTEVLMRHLATPASPPERPELPALDPAFGEALLCSVDAGMAACDASGRLTMVNGFLRDFFGDDSAGVPVKEWAQRFGLRHHDGSPLQTSEVPIIRALHGETVEHSGQVAVDRHGRQRWLNINARPVRAGDQTVIGAVAAVHDVTTEYRAQVYKSCKDDVLRALTRSPNADVAADAVVRILAVASGWPYVRLWMVDPVIDRLRPAATYTAAHERDLPVPTSLARGRGLAGTCWESGEMLWVPDIRAAGSPVLPEITAAGSYRAAGAIPVASGNRTIGVLSFFTHDQHEPEPALLLLLTGVVGCLGAYREQRRADELARSLAATTDDYIALVGHELRTPLTSIVAYVQLVAESPDLTDELRALIAVVDRNSRRLRHLIDQLLDVAGIESGHMSLAIEEVDLGAAIAGAVAEAEALAADSRITIRARAPQPLTIAGDPDRLAQMLHALLENAVKFSHDDAAVTVTAEAGEDTVVLTVTDNGVGLPTDEQPLLFRRLYRGENARHRGIAGNGLGLALCRAIIERHNGTITLSPHEPSGTTVTVRLPRSAQAAPTGQPH